MAPKSLRQEQTWGANTKAIEVNACYRGGKEADATIGDWTQACEAKEFTTHWMSSPECVCVVGGTL